MNDPHTAPPAPRPVDIRPLRQRKRAWAGSATGSTGTCSIVSAAGNRYAAGEFCRNSDHGAATTDASGTPITCSPSGSRWRWTDP
ncbi:hypothetical protein ACIQB5_08255 [Streptomyces sp. NPDC088560]|uniref:hypothetical protein n=1 Tax=Streptomyces sp. NPDC088560 TaxID=3365868 RepID=UPI003814F92F